MGEDWTSLFPEEEIAVETEKARVVEGADKLDIVENNVLTTEAVPLGSFPKTLPESEKKYLIFR
ncbi:hypothetical protein R9C00_00285 [Flammeovirgaceae bacterium SG7u.111]|nr:hypothetical protein [Flammeovirgaceae bacterium SG7u.132]WPO35891.1 hypothetical protein R9C00_00285 [Flammeovirgaceae bacterium SG7u.111]